MLNPFQHPCDAFTIHPSTVGGLAWTLKQVQGDEGMAA